MTDSSGTVARPRILLYRRIGVWVLALGLSFVIGYKARELDPQFAEWLASLEEGDGLPEPGTRLPFDATAYCKGTTTASGVVVRAGIAAADPALLPVGSIVNVATGDPKYDGLYAVMDTGPRVQGRHLDLYMWSCHEALAFGRRGVDVTVMRLGWNPQASAPSLVDRLFRGREARRRARAAASQPVVSPETVSSSPTIGPTPAPDGDAAAGPATDPAAPAVPAPAGALPSGVPSPGPPHAAGTPPPGGATPQAGSSSPAPAP